MTTWIPKADAIGKYLRRDLVSHTRKVQTLYKKLCRNEEAYLYHKYDIQYQNAIVRAEFEKNRHIKDMREARRLLELGEAYYLERLHPQPKYFARSPGGVTFERYQDFYDCHVDVWHPLEKAQYPYYFAKREERKKHYMELWEKKFGKPKEFGPFEHH